MSSADPADPPDPRPAWVRLVLWRMRARQTAWIVIWVCAGLAALLPHGIDSLFALAAMACLAAVGWMDRHRAWPDGSSSPLVPAILPWTTLVALLVLTLSSGDLCAGQRDACQAQGSLAFVATVALLVAIGSLAAGLAIWMFRAGRDRASGAPPTGAPPSGAPPATP